MDNRIVDSGCRGHLLMAYYRPVNLAGGLIRVSSFLFAAIGIGYLLAPAAMLSIVGIKSTPTSDFLMRTEGVALLTGAGLLAAPVSE